MRPRQYSDLSTSAVLIFVGERPKRDSVREVAPLAHAIRKSLPIELNKGKSKGKGKGKSKEKGNKGQGEAKGKRVRVRVL